jgi:hypothetical protein
MLYTTKMLAENAKMEEMGIENIYWIDATIDLSKVVAAHVDQIEDKENDEIIPVTAVHFDTGLSVTIKDDFKKFTKAWTNF